MKLTTGLTHINEIFIYLYLRLYFLKKILQYEWNIKVDIVPKKEADPLIMYFAINDMKYIYK